MHPAMLNVRFGSAESDTEESVDTYGALLLTYNICKKPILKPCMHPAMLSVRFGAAESDTEGSLDTYGALLSTYNIC